MATQLHFQSLSLIRYRYSELYFHFINDMRLLQLANFDRYYKISRGIHHTMDLNSFTVIAYQSAPACLADIENMTAVVRDATYQATAENCEYLEEALHGLEVMRSAISRFSALQNRQNSDFSDLDILDYEYSIVSQMQNILGFPQKELEFIRTSYYGLLSYIMGFMRVCTKLYSHLAPSMYKMEHSVSSDWTSLDMSGRVQWVERRLADWAAVDKAVASCREYHTLHPNFRKQSISALKGWVAAQPIIAGTNGDKLEIFIDSVLGLPKPKSLYVRIVRILFRVKTHC